VTAHVVVFAGPSVAAEVVRRWLPDADLRPPASRGDVWRAGRDGADVVALIDGYYEHVPPVWHKEILDALRRGCQVFGSSSMGAIRAAELAPFGMIGVGTVYELMTQGVIDDADVSVAHGPAPDHRVMSTPFANVHVTLWAAWRAGVVDASARDLVLACARSIFYAERTYPAILAAANDAGADAESVAELAAWLPTGALDQKRLDAEELLGLIATGDTIRRPTAAFSLNETRHFTAMCDEELSLGDPHASDRFAHPILEEVQLRPQLYGELIEVARTDLLAAEHARNHGVVVTQQLLDEASDELRRQLGLASRLDVERWLAHNQLDWDAYGDLVERRLLAHWGHRNIRGERDLREAVIDLVRIRGRYAGFVERATAKAEMLRSSGLDEAGVMTHAPIPADGPLDWFLSERVGSTNDVTLADLASSLGFADAQALTRAVRREHLFEMSEQNTGVTDAP